MPLLEREGPLAALEKYWAQAREGHGLVVWIGGEAGVGKTSLVREFAQRAGDARVLTGACDALSTPRPLGPLIDVAAALEGEVARAVGKSGDRDAAFGALLAELGTRPTALIVEDAHWADAATIDLLRFLSRRIGRRPALLVVTWRDDEVGAQHPLRVLLGDLAASADVRRIALQPLSEAAVRTLAGGTGMDGAALFQRTAGNAFFVTELLSSPGLALPETVRDAVLARAARLPEPARLVLDVAAVIGESAALSILAGILGEKLPVEPCIESGLMVWRGERVCFRHDLARQAILAALPPSRRRQLHASVLETLRRRSPDLATLSHHAAGAGDPAAVLEFAVAAAKEAAALRSHREAAAQYERALSFAAHCPPAQRAALLEELSFECYLTRRIHDALEARLEAADLRQRLGDGLRYGDDLRWVSRLKWFSGLREEAEEWGGRAIETLELLPAGRELAAAYSNQSQLLMLSCEVAPSIRWGRKALAMARRIGDRAIECHALTNIGASHVIQGESRGWAEMERCRDLALALRLDDDAGRAWAALISNAVEQRQFRRADTLLAEGIAYTSEHDLDAYRVYFVGWRAVAELHQGRLDAALREAQAALQQVGVTAIHRVLPLTVIGRVRARRGEAQVWPPLDDAIELATQTGELQRIGPARIARSEAAWLGGDEERARAEAKGGLALALTRREPWIAGELLVCARRAGLRVRPPRWCAKPFRDQLRGRQGQAVREWKRLDCPFEAALALAESGKVDDLRQAFAELDGSGMVAAAARVARRLRELGASKVPRGRRASTRVHPAGLTAREAEIVALLGERLSNAEIAQRLFISPKTVDHHVSAILAKLGVRTRSEAARWRPH
ncbi:MAG: AAA family ATPase [Myxococcales bacterium]|nr:AAA family ATPase [Myxococcales bacterium]